MSSIVVLQQMAVMRCRSFCWGICMALGEAAGRAARIAQETGVEPADVSIEALQRELRETGAYLGEQAL